jgi:hypothetical protein
MDSEPDEDDVGMEEFRGAMEGKADELKAISAAT